MHHPGTLMYIYIYIYICSTSSALASGSRSTAASIMSPSELATLRVGTTTLTTMGWTEPPLLELLSMLARELSARPADILSFTQCDLCLRASLSLSLFVTLLY